MPEYLRPDVYVEEIAGGPAPIAGVSTSVAAFIGETERGPTDATLITSMEEYRRVFGDYTWKMGSGKPSTSFMRHSLEGFFANGGQKAFVARVLGNNAGPASCEIPTTATGNPPSESNPRGRASGRPSKEGANGEANSLTPSPSSATDGGTKDTKAGGGDAGATRAAAPSSGDPVLRVEACGPGVWGNDLRVTIKPSHLSFRDSSLFDVIVEYKQDWGNDDEIPYSERYTNLSPDGTDQNFYEKRINAFSDLITIKHLRPGRPADSSQSKPYSLVGGSDGEQVKLADYTGNSEIGGRSGLEALSEIDELSILCAPNEGDVPGLTGELIAHCEKLRNRFAILNSPQAVGKKILESPQSIGPEGDLMPVGESDYAAYYFPWLKVIDGKTGIERLVPPCGHVAGIYARTDIERGVSKAPANAPVRGAIGLQLTVLNAEQDILNPRGVNCIRPFAGRGTLIWSARTISADPGWKYINVRRLFIFIEESIRRSTQWVVFEPNNELLWDRIKQTVSDFLVDVWRDGALMGRSREEAFFVKCDRTTMTDNDIENGRVIILIGIAPVRPAEFVIFRLSQWQGGSAVES
jgi:uncharacterized protein